MRSGGAAVLVAPTALGLGLDLARRGSLVLRFDALHALSYAASLVESVLLWGGLLYLAASRGDRVRPSTPASIDSVQRRSRLALVAGAVFALGFTLANGVESAIHARYGTYLGVDGQLTTPLRLLFTGALPLSQPAVAARFAVALAAAAGLLVAAQRWVRPRPRAGWQRAALLGVVVVGVPRVPTSYQGVQATLPDVLYANSLAMWVNERWFEAFEAHETGLARPGRRSPAPLPALVAAPARPRNVLLLLEEAQRADVTCTRPVRRCALATPGSNAEAPHRLALLELRAVASSTAISTAVIWSGVDPTASREALHRAPLLWDYAHAAGYDTAYWTAQDLMFGNARFFVEDLPLSRFASGTSLDPECDLLAGAPDALVADRAIADWGALREPFFAVAHFSSVHRPRLVDPSDAPFQPSARADTGGAEPEDVNRYRNAVYLSDKAVARLLHHVRSTESGRRTVVVYTSDHGESFFEHAQDNNHAGSVFDEELRVPGWVDAPPGTLSAGEQASLQAAEKARVTHLDFAPTLLDLLGLWDVPAVAPFRAGMLGHPLTRGERTTGPVPITNVSWVWEYKVPSWGLLQGRLKLSAMPRDEGTYRCFDLDADPRELRDLGEVACGALPGLARALYRGAPVEKKHLGDLAAWGDRTDLLR